MNQSSLADIIYGIGEENKIHGLCQPLTDDFSADMMPCTDILNASFT